MRNRPTEYLGRLSGLVIVAMLAGCAQHSTQNSDATQAGMSSNDIQNVDTLFDQANTDERNGLSALDLERLGLGDHWNTLDENGDGQISRQEFRKRLDDPVIQQQLHARMQDSKGDTSAQAVSSSWRLPPEPASQTWQRSKATTAPATMSAPSSAPWGVTPQTAPAEELAPVELPGSTEDTANSISP